MKTGAHLKIKQFGNNAMGVTLEGNPSKPEPDYFHIKFPGGEVYVARTTDGEYWAHVNVNHPNHRNRFPGDNLKSGRLVDGRQDVIGKAAVDCHPGELGNPNLEHVAVRVAT